MLFLFSTPLLKAQEPGAVQDFLKDLDSIKDPFDDGLPKPVVIKAPEHQDLPEPPVVESPAPNPEPLPVIQPPVVAPQLHVQGVIVGEEIHQAIINDRTVPLLGFIDGGQVISVTKRGVELLYKGKKFFFKVD
jgi:hypothetical protein